MEDLWYLYMDTKTGPPEGFSTGVKLRARKCFAPPRKTPVQTIIPSP
jgi:hypothetical protein